MLQWLLTGVNSLWRPWAIVQNIWFFQTLIFPDTAWRMLESKHRSIIGRMLPFCSRQTSARANFKLHPLKVNIFPRRYVCIISPLFSFPEPSGLRQTKVKKLETALIAGQLPERVVQCLVDHCFDCPRYMSLSEETLAYWATRQSKVRTSQYR